MNDPASSWLPQLGVGAWLLVLLIACAVLCVLAYSLIAGREPWELEGAGLVGRLRKRRERLLRALKDLELEKEAGTLNAGELATLRADLKRRAIQVTKDLDRARRSRLRSLLGGQKGLAPAQRKHVESLVAQRVALLEGNKSVKSMGDSK